MPTFISDATIDAELLRPIWPTVEASPRYAVAMPHVTVRQVVDRGFAKVTLAVGEATTDAERQRRANNVLALYSRLLRHAGQYGGADVLVIVQKAVRAEIEANYVVPPWLHLAHHGAVAGLDAYKAVRAVYVVGRTLPPSSAVARAAGALSGHYVKDREYVDGAATIATTDGAVTVETKTHPDPLAERIRWNTTEGGLLQAIGRGRGVNRSAADPLDVHLWTDIPLPELGPVRAEVWDQIPGGIDEEMIAVGGVAFENAADAARFYPTLFPSAGAAKKARQRAEQKGTNPYSKNILIGECPHLLAVTYRRAGERIGAAAAYALPCSVPGLPALMTERLGPLVTFEVADAPAAATSAAPSPRKLEAVHA